MHKRRRQAPTTAAKMVAVAASPKAKVPILCDTVLQQPLAGSAKVSDIHNVDV